jgi:lysophospholipase
VLAHDWRGQGLSDRLAPDDPLKGSSDGSRAYLRDFDQILQHFGDQLPQPWILMGHSMGGGLNCLSLALGEKRFAAAVMSAPMIGIQTAGRAPWIVRLTAKLTCVLGGRHGWAIPPADPFAETFETNLLTHDEFRWRHWRGYLNAHPELALGGVTWSWIRFAMDLTAKVNSSRRVEQLSIPVTIVAAELEKLVDNRASQTFARRAPRGKYVQVDGAYHEVLMETHLRRQQFWSAFDQVASQVAP